MRPVRSGEPDLNRRRWPGSPATDHFGFPRARQIGITGHSIAPRLFVSIGASGKFNHTVGVRLAGTILAINPDPDAPVWECSDIGIVGPWQDVLPLLEEKLTAVI